MLEAWVSGLIELNKLEWMLGAGQAWKPGEKLKLLFAGYNGSRNTGSDVRVEEILRQVRRILGDRNLALSVMTLQLRTHARLFWRRAPGVSSRRFPDVPALAKSARNHGVVACEGSMFKSKFANALTTMMIGALGIAAAQNKLSVGYGGEAGAMDPFLQKMCKRFCRDSLIITRNPESQEVLGKLGVADRTRHRYGMDFRTARPRIWAKGAPRRGLGRHDAGPRRLPHQSLLVAGETFAYQMDRALGLPAPTRRATTARSIFTARAAMWTPLTENILRPWPAGSRNTARRARSFPFSSEWKCWTATPASASRKKSAACRFFRPIAGTCGSL